MRQSVCKIIRTSSNHRSVLPKLIKLEEHGDDTLISEGVKADIFVAHLMRMIHAMGTIALREIHDRVERADQDSKPS